MNGVLPELRRGIRNQDRLRRLLSNRIREQNTPQESRLRVAEANHRARRVSMLQMQPRLLSSSDEPRPERETSDGMRRSHRGEVPRPSSSVGFVQRKIGMQLPSRFLPHRSSLRRRYCSEEVQYPRVSNIAVIVGVLLASFAYPSIAASPQPDVKKIMTEYLSDLKVQWIANQKHYVEEQARVHGLAEKARQSLCEVGELKYCKDVITVKVTSYNPVEGQTDSSPCSGAGGDVCAAYDRGERPIALSQDLIKTLGGGPFKMGDVVEMQGGKCSGTFTVIDTMNARHKMRADIFNPKQSKNIGCQGVLLVRR